MVFITSASFVKLLIIGLGSSGQRYARVLRSLFPDSRIYVYRGKHRMGLINKALTKIDQKIDPVDHYCLTELNLNQARSEFYDFVVICTPVDSHLFYAKQFYLRTKKLLIEKPLCYKAEEILEFTKIQSNSDVKILVGYQNFYNPIFLEILKQYRNLKGKKEIQMDYLEPLSAMNPFRDMSTHHLATPQGGGALLALSHELEFLFRLEPAIYKYLTADCKVSDGSSKILDSFIINLRHSTENISSLVLNLSFALGSNKRGGIVKASGATIVWDLKKKILRLIRNGEEKLIKFDYDSDELIGRLVSEYLFDEIQDSDLSERFTRAKQVVELSFESMGGKSA